MPNAANPGFGFHAALQHDAQGRAPGPGGLLSAVINTSASGDTSVVTGVSGKIICVYAYLVIADNGPQQVGFKDGASFIEGPFACGATGIPGGAAPPGSMPPFTLFKCGSGNSLIINLSQAIHVGGRVSYWLDSP